MSLFATCGLLGGAAAAAATVQPTHAAESMAWAVDTLVAPDTLAQGERPGILDSLQITTAPKVMGLDETLRQASFPFWGQALTSGQAVSLRAALDGALRRQGFPFARFTLTPVSGDTLAPGMPLPSARREGRQGLVLHLHVETGEGFKLGGLTAQGSRTRPEVLLRLALLQLGETFDESRVTQGLARLRRQGYYAAVDSIGLVRDGERNLLFPVLRLSDHAGNHVGGLLGYDSEAGRTSGADALSGYLQVHLVNVRGTARDLDFDFESRPRAGGRSDREVRLRYVEPWLPGLPVGLRLAGSIWLQDSLYDQIDGSAALLHDLDMHARLEWTFARQWSREFAGGLESEAYAGGLGLFVDQRDRSPFTLRGYRLEWRAQGIRRTQQAPGMADSSRYLVQGQMRAEGFYPLETWGLRRILLHGLLDAGGDWPREPWPARGDRFDIGGARSLRGYREREFSTDLYAYTHGELQYLLDRRGRLLLFAAPGLINRQASTVWWRRVFGYGAGLELGSEAWSIGLLYALNPERTWGQGLLHVTVENRF